MKSGLFIILQLLLLWAINSLGYFIVDFLHVPIPGNVMGLLILFILLVTNVIPIRWIEQASSLLIKHLAFFFIPIAVGLMALGAVFLNSGISLFISMFISIMLGIYLTGIVSQSVSRKEEGAKNENSHHTV